jgi:hypothetical protein
LFSQDPLDPPVVQLLEEVWFFRKLSDPVRPCIGNV